jgi:hypothetical protein
VLDGGENDVKPWFCLESICIHRLIFVSWYASHREDGGTCYDEWFKFHNGKDMIRT